MLNDRSVVAWIISIACFCTILTEQVCFGQTEERQRKVVVLDAEKKLGEFLPDLRAFGEKYANDVEIQLGLAYLYDQYKGPMPPEGFLSAEEQYEKVLTLDPGNCAAWANSARLLCKRYTATRSAILDELERAITHAEKRGVTQLRIPRGSRVYDFVEAAKYGPVDFSVAVEQLRSKLDEEMQPALDTLIKGQARDPNNALYGYLRAHLYFELNEQIGAIQEIQKAIAKEYWSNYAIEISNARSRVLREAGFPEAQRHLIEDWHLVFADFLLGQIWEKGLKRLAKSYETQGDFENAEKMYMLTIGMAKHIKEEPVPYISQTNQKIGESLENRARECITELRKRMME
jgi:tetratricopeptide (TPR) repeat protein